MQWKGSDMKAAMEAVSSGEMTVTASSKVPWVIELSCS